MSWISPASNYEHGVVSPELLKAAEAEAKKMIEAEEQED